MENKNIDKAVCRCKKVFFEDIEDAIKNGATTFEEIQEVTKISTGCKRCLKNAKEISQHLLSK